MERTRVSSPGPMPPAGGAGGLALALILALAAAEPGTARGQAPAAEAGAGAGIPGPLRAEAGQPLLLPRVRRARRPPGRLEELGGVQAAERHQARCAAGRPRRPGHRAGAAVGPARQAGQAGRADRPVQARREAGVRRRLLGRESRRRRVRHRRARRRPARGHPPDRDGHVRVGPADAPVEKAGRTLHRSTTRPRGGSRRGTWSSPASPTWSSPSSTASRRTSSIIRCAPRSCGSPTVSSRSPPVSSTSPPCRRCRRRPSSSASTD